MRGFSSMSIFTKSTLSVVPAISSSAGSIALHGPHHGAQKSTTTGPPACSTSCSKVASVTARIGAYSRPHSKPSRGTRHTASSTIVWLIFDAPTVAVDERDRHLDHLEAGPFRAVCQLDLERVALGAHRVQVEPLEHAPPEALEAAGRVLTPMRRKKPRVGGGAARDEPAHYAPVPDAPALHVARAEHQVGALLGRRDQPRHVVRVVREVAVHLEDQLRALRERVCEAGDVRRAEAFLPLPVQDVDEAELRGQLVGELTRPVRRVVVDHEHAVALAQHLGERIAPSARRSRARCRSEPGRSPASAGL